MTAQDKDSSLIRDIIKVCHRLEQKGMVSATDGNVSARTDKNTFYATRSSVNKGEVDIKDIVEIDIEGNLLQGNGRPSTEMKLHLFIYSQRSDVKAVIHAHPPYATAFAVAGIPLDKPVFPEVLVMLGKIPLAPYATPSTEEVGESIRPFIQECNAILLANHGVVTYGASLKEAYLNMEKVEHAAMVTYLARMLGGERELTPAQIDKLANVSEKSYGKKIRK